MDDELFEFEPTPLDADPPLFTDEDEQNCKIISDEHSLKLVNTRDTYTTTIVLGERPSRYSGSMDYDEFYEQEQKTVEEEDGELDIEDEELYDKFVPTDPSQIEAYKKRIQLEQDYVLSTKPEKPRPMLNCYTPPENFSIVCGEIYRSSFPRIENFDYLKKLNLKSIICLIPEEYPNENIEFNQTNDIDFYQIGLSGNKEPFVKIRPNLVNEALEIILDPKNHPILIHCNRGKHRTGCIVGCIRKLQKWSLSMIFDEYRKFAYPKERHLDQQFIEMFDDLEIYKKGVQNNWLPLSW